MSGLSFRGSVGSSEETRCSYILHLLRILPVEVPGETQSTLEGASEQLGILQEEVGEEKVVGQSNRNPLEV